MNGDGIKDLILSELHFRDTCDWGQCVWYSRNQSGDLHYEGVISFGGQSSPYGLTSIDYSLTATVKDLNGDGLPDITTGFNWYGNNMEMRIYYNAGTKAVPSYQSYVAPVIPGVSASGTQQFIKYGDFNGDGISDVAIFSGDHYENIYWLFVKCSIYLNTGTEAAPVYGAMDTSFLYSGAAERSFNGTIGDLNGDGLDDVIEMTGDSTSGDFWGKKVSVFYNTSPVVPNRKLQDEENNVRSVDVSMHGSIMTLTSAVFGTGAVTVRISDMSGRTVFVKQTKTVAGSSLAIPLESISKGAYVASVFTNGNCVAKKVFVRCRSD